MAWEQLAVNKPHLVYILLGAFTSIFMLCSSVIKERLYIGEATVATLFGIIFGPYAANLIVPDSWGNTDQITLEFSRIVLVVQCFAVGVELPKAYMERHWRSVVFLLVPIMTFGWLVTSLFIWGLFIGHLNWLDSLTIAACVTATDPVLASSVVGKGKFAKRVPKHLRDLLSAESGCNDGMAFPFIYLALYIIRFRPSTSDVAFHWFCYTILYECIFGAFYGVAVGYLARRLIRYAHEHDLIDRESFLVFYFVLALFCAGSGSILGIDDLLVGFACGVGFSNDGWFTEKTEESHVSNVIDLLLNLTFFVYFGTIIPWDQYNSGIMGLNVWRLVVIGLLVLFFRRIPVMLAFKPVIPDIKTWREALFAGHFGPIGVGAIFVAILARAELENETTEPLAVLPTSSTNPHANVIYLVWPIVTFLVTCSIIVHGSSIAVFTLGKHINTLTLTMSFTQANERGPTWIDRLPRIQSRSKSQMSVGRSEASFDEKSNFSQTKLPFSAPGTFLRRQREDDNPSRQGSRAPSRHRSRRSKNWDYGIGPGGPVSQSAIAPTPRHSATDRPLSRSDSDTLAIRSDPPSNEKTPPLDTEVDKAQDEPSPEIYEEGDDTVYEDDEGNVLAVEPSNEEESQRARENSERREGKRLIHRDQQNEDAPVSPTTNDPGPDLEDRALQALSSHEKENQAGERPGKNWRNGLRQMSTIAGLNRRETARKPQPEPPAKPQKVPARAYQYGNTVIVEDEDGEVIRKFDIQAPDKKQGPSGDGDRPKPRLGQMGKMFSFGGREGKIEAGAPGKPRQGSGSAEAAGKAQGQNNDGGDDDDDGVRFTLAQGGRRMSKAEFIDELRAMDPRSRAQTLESSDAPEPVKQEAKIEARKPPPNQVTRTMSRTQFPMVPERPNDEEAETAAALARTPSDGSTSLRQVESGRPVPHHDVSAELRRFQLRAPEGGTAAERRRRQAALQSEMEEEDSEDDGTDRVPPVARRNSPSGSAEENPAETAADRRRRVGTTRMQQQDEEGETAAERRRRLGALGIRKEEDSDTEEDDQPREPPRGQRLRFVDQPPERSQQQQQQQQQAQQQDARQSGVRWARNVSR